MKIRSGFVSNSSSASFILDKRYMTEEQIEVILKWEGTKWDHWDIEETEDYIKGFTICDNGELGKLFQEINLGCKAILECDSEIRRKDEN